MAYNVLKGMVEGSVDQHADQEIEGVKVFKSTVSASVFYDTDARAPCITANDLPIKHFQKESPGGIVVYTGKQQAETHHDFRYQGKTLYVPHVCSVFDGDGSRLKNLPVTQFSGTLPAESLTVGLGLHGVRGALQVKVGDGISCDEDGIEVSVASQSGLSFKGRRLTLDTKACETITKNGQNLSDDDTLFVYDASLNEIRSTTLSNLQARYISERVPHPTGDINSVQLKGRNGFLSSDSLTFSPEHKILSLDGTLRSRKIKNTHIAEFLGPVRTQAQVCHAIKSVKGRKYEVEDDDYTLLIDSGKAGSRVVLPPAANSRGRVLILKKVNSDKYKLNSGPVKVVATEGKIDISEQIIMKMNYSSRTLQSDGENWWLIGSKGS